MSQATPAKLLKLSLLLALSTSPSHGSCSSSPHHVHVVPRQDAPTSTAVVVGSTITVRPSLTPSTSPDLTDDDTFTSAVLNSSNTYRGQHGAEDLRWNKTLEEFALDYFAEVAPDPDSESDSDGEEELPQCVFQHSGGPYGENLAIGCNSAAGCVEAWGDERELGYPFGAEDGFSMETGHFSQLVWKNTTDVGCARKKCAGSSPGGYTKGYYLICEYWPRGNVAGQYAQMVGKYEGSEPLGGGGVERRRGDAWRVMVAVGFVVGLLW